MTHGGLFGCSNSPRPRLHIFCIILFVCVGGGGGGVPAGLYKLVSEKFCRELQTLHHDVALAGS